MTARQQIARLLPLVLLIILVIAALRFVLRYGLGAAMVAIAPVLLSDLHLHFCVKPHESRLPVIPRRAIRTPPPSARTGSG